jgi:citrate lyase beta subunit
MGSRARCVHREEIAWADRVLDAASAPDADGVIDLEPMPESLRRDHM